METKDNTLLTRKLKRWRLACAVLAVLCIGLLALYIHQAWLFTVVEENRARNPNIAESTGGPEDFDVEQFLQDNPSVKPAPTQATEADAGTEALVDDVQAEFSTDIKNLLESVRELEVLKQQLDADTATDALPAAE